MRGGAAVNPYAILAALALCGAMVGGAYWQGRKDGAAGEIATRAREDKAREQTREAAIQGAAQAISTIKVQHRTITQEVQREVLVQPQYRDCAHSPDGLRNINAALTGAAQAQPAGVGVVPGADAPR